MIEAWNAAGWPESGLWQVELLDKRESHSAPLSKLAGRVRHTADSAVGGTRLYRHGVPPPAGSRRGARGSL
jgi:hypothetical protein